MAVCPCCITSNLCFDASSRTLSIGGSSAMRLGSFATEDTTNDSTGNDNDGNWYTELDPVTGAFLDRSGSDESGGFIVVRVA